MRSLHAVVITCSSLLVACLDPGVPPVTAADSLAADTSETDAAQTVDTTPDTTPDDATGDTRDTAIAGDTTNVGVTVSAREGDEVIPQTLLHLEAAWPEADANDDPVVAWEWSVVQPDGSVSVFWPSASVATPTFEVNVAGQYTFTAELTTASGKVAKRSSTFFVVPDEAIHVELLWRTPGDPDETDVGGDTFNVSSGSDVDLHFARRAASGPDHDGDGHPDAWFGDDDCFWATPAPTWGEPAQQRSPRLDRDDTDGGGPENLNLEQPDADACFDIAVHYWNDWTYGPADITLRIYLYGLLVEVREVAALAMNDLWLVGELCMGVAPAFHTAERCTADGTCTSWVVPDYTLPDGYRPSAPQ